MEETKKMTLRLPPNIHLKLAEEAKARNRSIHNLILTILIDHFSVKP